MTHRVQLIIELKIIAFNLHNVYSSHAIKYFLIGLLIKNWQSSQNHPVSCNSMLHVGSQLGSCEEFVSLYLQTDERIHLNQSTSSSNENFVVN